MCTARYRGFESHPLRQNFGVRTVWIISKKQQILIADGSLPEDKALAAYTDKLSFIQDIGTFQNNRYYAAHFIGAEEHIGPYRFQDLRSLYAQLEPTLFMFLGKAIQLTNWLRTHQFCGSCGTPTQNKPDERARLCPHCQQVFYPRISPAIIVGVVRQDELLLARSTNVPNGMYSILAGFVEPGETLEECVAREVREEVGIEVKDISYFGSQPWPFPDSLMIGFTAAYASGDIAIDNKEIVEARWFSRNNLPANIPTAKSISSQIIEWFRQDMHN